MIQIQTILILIIMVLYSMLESTTCREGEAHPDVVILQATML